MSEESTRNIYLRYASEGVVFTLAILYSLIRVQNLIVLSNTDRSFQFGIAYFSATIFAFATLKITDHQKLSKINPNVSYITGNHVNLYFEPKKIRYVVSCSSLFIWFLLYASPLVEINMFQGYGLMISVLFLLVAAYTGREVFFVLVSASVTVGFIELIHFAVSFLPEALMILLSMFIVLFSLIELIDVKINS